MDEIKVCPRCDAEYYAHVEVCAKCEVALVAPAEAAKAKAALPDAAGGELVCVMEGKLDRVTELARGLVKDGFDARPLRIPGSGGCSTDEGFGIFVDRSQAAVAVRRIEELWHSLYPEMRAAQERMDAGLCPACGARLSTDNPACPDCGLFLGDPSCFNDPSCGSCDT